MRTIISKITNYFFPKPICPYLLRDDVVFGWSAVVKESGLTAIIK